jgi:2-polyprenyl-3-methyl-5-hydroxy-6-metoxy-1,4-benzoquinol methylase
LAKDLMISAMIYKEHSVEWNDEKVARFWDVISKNKALTETYFTKMVGDEVISDIHREIGIEGKEVLDYGSGPGYLLESILKQNIKLKYSALEFSKDSINYLQDVYGSKEVFEKAYYVGSFPSDIAKQFDVIICCEVVEHLDDKNLYSFINEAKKLLKSGGYIYITTPNEENLDLSKVNCPDCGGTFHRWQHMRSWSGETLKAFMESNGFKTQKVKALNYFDKKSTIFQVKNFVREKLLRRKLIKNNLCYIGKV